MIVYKVVRDGGESMFAPKPWCRTYRVGKTTKPIYKSLLFAFDSLDSAIAWLGPGRYNAIYKCTATVSKRHIAGIPNGSRSDHSLEVYREFWKAPYFGDSPPAGTILCERITPIKIMTLEKV